MAKKFDAIIIGPGQSGPSLAARMTAEGMKTAIIERKLFGGTCVNVGCIPTKTLVASARAAYMARRCAEFDQRSEAGHLVACRVAGRLHQPPEWNAGRAYHLAGAALQA